MTPQFGHHHHQKLSKLKKLRLFLKSIRSKVNKNKRDQRKLPQYLPTVNQSPLPSVQYQYQYPNPYSYTYTSFQSSTGYQRPLYYASSCIVPGPAVKQHVPKQMMTESEYEEMSNDFCTLPRKRMKLRMKQRVFEKSLNAILLEARREIIEESSEDEQNDTYVAEAKDNIYEELNLSRSYIDEIYEEIL